MLKILGGSVMEKLNNFEFSQMTCFSKAHLEGCVEITALHTFLKDYLQHCSQPVGHPLEDE